MRDPTSASGPRLLERFDLANELQRAIPAATVAEWLHLPEERVLAMAEAGEIPARSVGGAWLFGVASINLWLEGKSLEDCLRTAVEQAIATRVVSVTGGVDFQVSAPLTLEDLEMAYIRYVVKSVGDNKTLAAERLGIDPSTLYRKLARVGE